MNSASQTILVLGDSLSAEYGIARGSGWVALLGQRLTENGVAHQIVNASISGETTAGGRSRINKLLQRHQPKLVIVELGANDALRGLDLNSTHKNLATITMASQKSGAAVLLLGMQVPPNYGPAYGKQFSQIYARIATESGAALVPFWFEQIATDMSYFQADGIHPNRRAQPLLLDAAWSQLKPLLR